MHEPLRSWLRTPATWIPPVGSPWRASSPPPCPSPRTTAAVRSPRLSSSPRLSEVVRFVLLYLLVEYLRELHVHVVLRPVVEGESHVVPRALHEYEHGSHAPALDHRVQLALALALLNCLRAFVPPYARARSWQSLPYARNQAAVFLLHNKEVGRP